jgi:hypothetical protein
MVTAHMSIQRMYGGLVEAVSLFLTQLKIDYYEIYK